MGFDKRQNAKPYTPQDGDTLQKIAARETAAGRTMSWQDIAKFNWGTADPDEINRFLRDELACHQRDPSNAFLISADAQPKGRLLIPAKFKADGLDTRKRHTLNVKKQPPPPKQFRGCAMVKGVCFAFASSFIRPSVLDDLKRLEKELAKYPDGKIMIFGHTDKVGSEDDNKALSERRAKSVYAFITNDADAWEALYNHPQEKDHWGLKVVQTILKDLGHDPGPIDGVMGPKTRIAIARFDADSLDNTPALRKKLFAAYMSGKHDIAIAADRFMVPKHTGCGEFNVAVDTADPCEANRRVTFYIFHAGRLPKLPCHSADASACRRQSTPPKPRFKDTFRCSFYDSIAKDCPCESIAEQHRAKLTEVSWKEDQIDPLYYPEIDDQRVGLTVKTENVNDGTDGSRFEISLFGYYDPAPDGQDQRRPVQLPLDLLGIATGADLQVRSGQLVSVRAGDRPALELRLHWDKVTALDDSEVYLNDFATFRVKVALLDGLPADGLWSDELRRLRPVVIFANPDGAADQEWFWKSGETIRDNASGADYLTLLEAGHSPAIPSVFESGATRGPIPARVALTFMRGSLYTFYRGHGSLLTQAGDSPCNCCKFRDHWDRLSSVDKENYLWSVISPTKWDGAKYVPISWAALKKSAADRENIYVQFTLDESRGDPNYTPAITASNENLDWFSKVYNVGMAILFLDKAQLQTGLQFCMPRPTADDLAKAAKSVLQYKITTGTATHGPAFATAAGALKGAPSIVDTATAGTMVPANTPIHIPTVCDKCMQGEDTANTRAGYIFWQTTAGGTFATTGGQPALCFSPDWLTPDKVAALKGRHPTPAELLYAGGCLTAAKKELAESFLKKGTRVYIGNRIVAWGNWSTDFSAALSKAIFTDGTDVETAFNDLKAEYVGKLRCAMFVKTDGGTKYVDQ